MGLKNVEIPPEAVFFLKLHCIHPHQSKTTNVHQIWYDWMYWIYGDNMVVCQQGRQTAVASSATTRISTKDYSVWVKQCWVELLAIPITMRMRQYEAEYIVARWSTSQASIEATGCHHPASSWAPSSWWQPWSTILVENTKHSKKELLL